MTTPTNSLYTPTTYYYSPCSSDSELVTMVNNPKHLTSKGVSKGFIILFLEKCLDYVKTLKRDKPNCCITFPFPDIIFRNFIEETTNDFLNSSTLRTMAEGIYPGHPFEHSDTLTYWTSPAQFRTWWKNNIERKKRLDATLEEHLDVKALSLRAKRSNFRKMSVCLAENIRAHFSRFINMRGGILIQPFDLPFELLLSPYRPNTTIDIPPTPMKKKDIFGKFSLVPEKDDSSPNNQNNALVHLFEEEGSLTDNRSPMSEQETVTSLPEPVVHSRTKDLDLIVPSDTALVPACKRHRLF